MVQMEAIAETRHSHETDQWAEDDCMNHYDMRQVQMEAALLVRSCHCHDDPVEEENHEAFQGSFEEETDVEVVIVYGIVGRAQAGYRTGCAEHSWESGGQTQLDSLCLDVWEVMIVVK